MQELDFLSQPRNPARQAQFTGRQWTLPQPQAQQDFAAPAVGRPVLAAGMPEIDPESSEGSVIRDALQVGWDISAAPRRGLESFVRGTYGAVDWLAQDKLPDWDKNILTGSSETAIGGFLESTTSFAVGFFIPAGLLGRGAGILSKANQASKVTKLGRATVETARATTAGAISDFTLYDHQEARLSQLQDQFPGSADPINAYMAGEIEDSELMGRLKQVAKGAALGVGLDAFVYGIRAVRAGRLAMQKGASPEAVLKAAQEANKGIPMPGVQPLPEPDAETLERARSAALNYLDLQGNRDFIDQVEAPGIQRNPRNPAPEPGRTASEAVSSGGVVDTRQANLTRFTTPEEGLMRLRALELEGLKLYRANPDLQPKSTAVSNMEAGESYRDLLVQIGATEAETPRIAMALAEKLRDSTNAVRDADILARISKGFLNDTLTDLNTRFKALDAERNDEAFLETLKEFSALEGLTLNLRGHQAAFGRGLQGMDASLPDIKSIKVGDYKDMLSRLIDATDPTKPMAVKPLSTWEKFWGVTNEVWSNSILSGMRTISLTAMSATSLTVYNPIERMLGGAARALSEKELEAFTEVYRYNRDFFRNPKIAASIKRDAGAMQGLLDNIKGFALANLEAVKFARQAFSQGPLLTPRTGTNEFGKRAISSDYLGMNKDSMAGRFVDMLGKAVNIPLSTMGSVDEFFKQINGRGIAKAELYRRARTLGVPDGQIDAFVYDRMESLLANGRMATEESMAKRLKEEMSTMTFSTKEERRDFAKKWWDRNFNKDDQILLQRITDATDQINMTASLRPGTLGAWVQEGTYKHPYLRLIATFIRTPTNLLNWTIRDRGPQAFKGLGEWYTKARFDPEKAKALAESHNLTLRDLASGDSIRQSEAYGRVAAATGFVASAAFLASSTDVLSERLTGQGPTNPAMRQAWLQAGYQPFSIRVGDKWVSYARLDPFATPVGLIADLIDIGKWAPESDQSLVEEGMSTVIAALAHNFTNKSYFQGITDFLEVVTEPTKFGEKWVSRMAGNVVPNFFAQGVQTYDPVMRDARGVIDRIISRTPAYGMLDPQRNVLGEEITRNKWLGPEYVSPIAYTDLKDDIIFEEMLLLRRAFSPPRPQRSGIDFREYKSESGQSAYDRWLELSGETVLGGLGLRDRLRQVITSPQYQRLSPEEIDGIQSARVRPLKSIIEKYQQHAYFKMLREYPDLDQDLRQKRELRQRSFQPQTAGAPAPQASGGPSQSPLFSLTR